MLKSHMGSSSESEGQTFPPSSHSISNLSSSSLDTTCPTVWKNLSASCKCLDYFPFPSPPSTHHLSTAPDSPNPGYKERRVEHQLNIVPSIVLEGDNYQSIYRQCHSFITIMIHVILLIAAKCALPSGVVSRAQWGSHSQQNRNGRLPFMAGFQRESWDPGSQEIIKTHRKSMLELPVLTFQVELLSGFPVNKKKICRGEQG